MIKKPDDIESIVCCGRPMEVSIDIGSAWEARCAVCGDIIYIKKETPKPKLLDD